MDLRLFRWFRFLKRFSLFLKRGSILYSPLTILRGVSFGLFGLGCSDVKELVRQASLGHRGTVPSR